MNPRYSLLSSLGRGGMGEVWLADDTQLGRKVAIKFLTEALENDASARERLHREARSAAALDHPYICKIHEIAEVDGRTGIVMEHVSGETLRAALDRAPIAPQQALRIASEIAEALDEAHTQRLVHRDLKPANVMLTSQGHVKVMDFGLAKPLADDATPVPNAETLAPITSAGVRVGTPGYMAPEQLLGADADARSDIFAFGILLYELLAGLHPFHRSSQSGTMTAIVRDAPAPVTQYQAALPDSATAVVGRLLDKDPERRQQTFADVRADLTGLLDAVSGSSSAATPAVMAGNDDPPDDGRTPYVGREPERAEARRLLDQAAGGRGATVLIGGEPGVGKTRFTEELIREARERGCLTLVGHCYETEGHPPFIPWVEMLERASKIVERSALRQALGEAAPEVAKIAPELRRVFPDIPEALELPPEQQRRYLFNAYQAFTERAVRVMPNVLVLEDLHWADEPTVLLMQHVAQHLSQLPLLLVGTYRDVELDVSRPFAKVLESLVRERLATRISLRRLGEADIEEMLGALGGPDPPAALARVVFHETEGNPFFVEEVFQHLKEEGRLFDDDGHWRSDLNTTEVQVPEGVRLVIGRRLERVSEDTRKALTVAAIIGRNFELSVLEPAAGIDPDALLDALEEAEGAQLITSATSGRDATYTFSHELIRQTLHGNLSLPRRQRLHLGIAEAVESSRGGDTAPVAALLAHHLFQAGSIADAGKTLDYLSTAGRQALSAAAFEEAVAHFTSALTLERLDGQVRADLLYARGGALRSLAQADDAIADWQEALTGYETLGDAAGMARTLWDLGWTFIWHDRAADGLAVAERTERVVPDETTADRSRTLAMLGALHGWVGDYTTFERRIAEARVIAEQLDDDRLLGRVRVLEATICYMYLKVEGQVAAGTKAATALRATGDAWELPQALHVLGVGLMFSGSPEQADRTAAEAQQLAARVGHDGALGNAGMTRLLVRMTLGGDLDSAEQVAPDLVAFFERSGPWSRAPLVWLSSCRFWRGAWDEASSASEQALTPGGPELPETIVEWAHGRRFLLQAYRGDRSGVDEFSERCRRLFRGGRTPFLGDVLLAVDAPEAFAMLDAREEAHRLYAPVIELLRGGCRGVGSLAETAAGIAASAGEQWETAEQHFETALAQAHDFPDLIAQPETRRWYAWMLLDRDAPGDTEKARTLLGEAVEMYRKIGMPKHLEIAEGMLNDL